MIQAPDMEGLAGDPLLFCKVNKGAHQLLQEARVLPLHLLIRGADHVDLPHVLGILSLHLEMVQ